MRDQSLATASAGREGGPVTPKRIAQRREGGFTLVELLLVMGVIFVLTAVVAPRFSDFVPSLRLKKTVDRLFAWAQKARAEAATTGLRHRLVVDAGGRKFWIDCENRPFRDPGKFMPLQGSWEEEIPDDLVLELLDGLDPDPANANLKVLEFRPDGTAAADATIIVASDRGDRSTIKIVAATSRISIETPPGQ